MTKKDIVRTISEEVGLTQQQTKKIVQKTFDAIIDCLVRDQRIELRNFGVFEVKPRAARKARNPRTGQQVDVPSKHVVTFKPGKFMESKVRQLDEESERFIQNLPTDSTTNSDSHAPSGAKPNLRSDSQASLDPPAAPNSGRWDDN
ncbi:MAG: HU family DNA-binding protein [Planctomycetota bacterium]